MYDVQSAWVYILRCSDGLYYVGSHRGPDPAVRVSEHNAGLDPKAFTYRRRPVELVWAGDFQFITDAIAFERQLKGWSRAKKEAVIQGAWEALPDLARSGRPRPSTGSG
ncbi:GIY-YIG nuclease family protein [Caulobacter sp.]|jgi:putative endonuclease|uniref:GIY-YIG nuclease family protein n=1 Tax=Caulobacter sp. TaxID=78 RepID=UPI001612AFF1